MDLPKRQASSKGSRPISTITIVDSLAEITRHQDRELLERSLAITLSELFPAETFRLFQIVMSEDRIKAALAAYSRDGVIISELNQEQRQLSEPLLEAVAEAIDSRNVVETPDQRAGMTHIVYPLYDKNDDVYGVLLQLTAEPGFNNQRLTYGLLRIYSNYLALLDDSHRDRLTHLLNRETLDTEITKRIIAHAQVDEQTYAQRRNADRTGAWLALVDIDFFKRINDGWGHLYGDEVLILLARLLEKIFRQEDLIFRYGGEEFVVLFQAPGPETADHVCERARETIANHSFPAVGSVTVSIGVTEICNQEGVSMVIDEADKALYYAKENGRNQVRFYSDLISAGLIKDAQAHADGGGVDFF
ncbi:GGDEF domain-containing protein [Thiorhodovibrio frisius]|uniref:diguanylate cyclase n=1 Tax=Thiorhodovibrio frisius TaxID=631362 RepID=H8YXX3_9GAMM|nr:GGDEF domain-containing protein [Thiorhodovibrio frisius]EIC23299.1 diguanylate cyclase (GGDEF) domain-containing protein [Thiorhodovibrio frisius]WPL23620.1 putative diguanylate cyclase YdaM [Thiorhodovibrio frisius]